MSESSILSTLFGADKITFQSVFINVLLTGGPTSVFRILSIDADVLVGIYTFAYPCTVYIYCKVSRFSV